MNNLDLDYLYNKCLTSSGMDLWGGGGKGSVAYNETFLTSQDVDDTSGQYYWGLSWCGALFPFKITSPSLKIV